MKHRVFKSNYVYAVQGLFKLSLLSLSISTAFASNQLADIDVISESPNNIQEKKIGQTIKTDKTIERQQIQDTRDLIRYETGVSVVEKGRMGTSGYQMRGVEENRVNITIDGLGQAETISSQGFKELFEGYGNFNNTRNGVEVENLKQVSFEKGANSTKVGSGALGGAVIFETKDARDFLLDKDFYLKTKVGYSSRNNEKLLSPTIAGRWKWFDALFIYTDRDGHETENYGYKDYPDIPELGSQGRARQKADPYNITKESTLFKLAFNPNENHRLTVAYDDSKQHSKGTDWSYTLAPLQTDLDKPELDSRHTNDSSTRRNVAFSYENYSSNPLWDSLKVTYSHQKIKQRARTDEYCDGEDNCRGVQNPLGLQLENGKLVDKEGNELLVGLTDEYGWDGKKTGNKTVTLVDKNGKEIPYPDETKSWNGEMVKRNQHDLWNASGDSPEVYLDCSIWDCNNTIRYHHLDGYNFVDDRKFEDIDLNKDQTTIEREWKAQGYDDDWNTIEVTKRKKTIFFVEDIQRGDKHYKHISPKETDWVSKGSYFGDTNYEGWRNEAPASWNDSGVVGYNNSSEYRLILPTSSGYVTNMWKDRSLNTDTKQLKLDLEKYLEIKGTEHQLSYGGLYSKTDKSMVNYAGYGSTNHKWWAVNAFDGIDENGNPDCSKTHSTFCTKTSPAETFLIPVITKTGSLYLADNFKLNDKISFNVGYRYDNIRHKPHYDPKTSPALPGGLVAGVFIPQPAKPKEPNEPRWWNFNSRTDPQYLAAMEQYEKDKVQYEKDLEAYKNNPQQNIDYLTTQKRKFKANSYDLSTTIDPLNFMRLQLKYSKGFRAPTSDELYFTFKHPDFSILPNLNLDAETARTREIALTFHKNNSFITFGGFKTNYDNFIELAFKGYRQFTFIDNNGNVQTAGIPYRTYQNVNNSKAWVKGFSVDAHLDLNDLTEKLKGFGLGYKFEYQKGKTFGIDEDVNGNEREIWHPINAISPKKHVVTASYYAPNDKYGIDVYYTHVSAKDKKDTYNPYHAADAGIFKRGDEGLNTRYQSKAYNVWDMVAFYKPIKNATIQLGVYNLFNEKYATWDSIRSIRQFGTSNMVCKNVNPVLGCGHADQGIERFYAPGRNFKLNMSVEF